MKCEDACSLLHPRYEITSYIIAWVPMPIAFTEKKVKAFIKVTDKECKFIYHYLLPTNILFNIYYSINIDINVKHRAFKTVIAYQKQF